MRVPRVVNLPTLRREATAFLITVAARCLRACFFLNSRHLCPTSCAAASEMAASRQGRPILRPNSKSDATFSVRVAFAFGVSRTRVSRPPSFLNMESMMASAPVLALMSMSGQYFLASSGLRWKR